MHEAFDISMLQCYGSVYGLMRTMPKPGSGPNLIRTPFSGPPPTIEKQSSTSGQASGHRDTEIRAPSTVLHTRRRETKA